MENFIIKFKNDLKQFQINRKKLIKQCEMELKLLERLVYFDPNILSEYTIDELIDKFITVQMFSSIEEIIHKLIDGKKREKLKSREYMENIYQYFSNFCQHIKKEYNETQNIINAYENDKIKEPIKNINTLFSQINHTTLNIKEISQIIGITISFNYQYAQKHKDHKIENIDIINQLSKYYNSDGTFKYNEDIETFKNLMKKLESFSQDETDLLYRILNLNIINFYPEIIILLQENNEKLRNNQIPSEISEETSTYNNHSMSSTTIKSLQELRKYYKNGTIIEIPKNLEEFYIILKQCELDENEQKFIINLINKQLSNNSSLTLLNYLNDNQIEIYHKANTLFNQFSFNSSDIYALKQYLEELQTISNMLEAETNEENKQYLLTDVPNIIEQLSLICNKYNKENNESTNKFIFLLNKNGIPYIYEDIDSLEQIYKKTISSLITKIDKSNQSQFRKVISNEPLAYNMYEVINTRAHIAFIEIDAGIYLIIGADIPRSGYKEFNNRLKSNQKIIKQIESIIKNPKTRNEMLESNEEYLTIFTKSNTSEEKINKLILKAHN